MVDQERLGALYAELGEANAEDVLCRAMEELANRLTNCEQFYRLAKSGELRKQARSLIAIADQIGMQMLSRAAKAVADCIDCGDPVALSATISRLLRIGERSLTAIWDQNDLSL